MAEPCDFVPDPCAALAIRACIQAKECILEALNFNGLEAGIGDMGGVSADLRVSMNAEAECMTAALEATFEAAGCPFPTVPDPPAPPDLSVCEDALSNISADVSDPLGFLEGLMTIEFDSEGLPTRITVP